MRHIFSHNDKFNQYILNADPETPPVKLSKLKRKWIWFGKQEEVDYKADFIELHVFVADSTGRLRKPAGFDGFGSRPSTASAASFVPQSIVRIFNARTLIPQSCAVATFTPAQYRKAQRLGLTLNQDDSLLAKIQGTLGLYLFDSLRRQEQWGMRTRLTLEKRKICYDAFRRLELLEKVERAYNKANKKQLETIVGLYISDSNRNEPGLRQAKSYIQVGDTKNLSYMDSDITAAEEFQRKIDDHPSEDTRNLVANFIASRANEVLRDLTLENEKLTIADGNNAFFRGSLNRRIKQAGQLLSSTYYYDQRAKAKGTNLPLEIKKEHQGNYEDSSKDEQLITVSSDQLKVPLRRFLFTVNYAINDEHAYNPDQETLSETSTLIPGHFGWLRKIWSHRTGLSSAVSAKAAPSPKVAAGSPKPSRSPGKSPSRSPRSPAQGLPVDSYYQMREVTRAAVLGFVSTTSDDVVYFFHIIYHWITHTIIASARNIAEVWNQLRWDFKWPSLPTPASQQPEVQPTVAANPIQAAVTLPAELVIPGPQSRMARPDTRLKGFDPDDFLSATMGGAEAFFNFMSLYYEIAPTAAALGSVAYVAGGLSVLAPEIFDKLFPSMSFYKTGSIAIAKAMSSSETSQLVTAAFTDMKIVLLTLDAIADGGDSTLGHAAIYLKNHLIQALVAGGFIIGAGYALSYGQIPVISEVVKADAGNVVFMEQSFIAAKLTAVVYHAFSSHPGETSLMARTIKLIAEMAIWPLRMLLIPINLISIRIGRELRDDVNFKPKYSQALLPLKDAAWFILGGSMRLADALLRLANVFGRSVKIGVKTISDVLFNGTATLINRPLSLVLAAIGASIGYLLFAHAGLAIMMSPAVMIALVLTGAMLGGILHYSLKGGAIKTPARGMLWLKHKLSAVLDRFLTRPLHEFYKNARNSIARILLENRIPKMLKRDLPFDLLLASLQLHIPQYSFNLPAASVGVSFGAASTETQLSHTQVHRCSFAGGAAALPVESIIAATRTYRNPVRSWVSRAVAPAITLPTNRGDRSGSMVEGEGKSAPTRASRSASLVVGAHAADHLRKIWADRHVAQVTGIDDSADAASAGADAMPGVPASGAPAVR